MNKIPFEDGTLVKAGYVEIDGVKHEVIPAEYTGETPLSAYNLKKMQDNIESDINAKAEEQNTLREDGDLVKRIEISGASEQEVTTQSANLFDKNKTLTAIGGSSGYVSTDYIPAITGDIIVKNNRTSLFFYDNTKTQLGTTPTWTNGTITIENVAYVRCNVAETEVATFMLVKNQDLPSEYVGFVPDSPSIEYEASIESVGDNINLFDVEDFVSKNTEYYTLLNEILTCTKTDNRASGFDYVLYKKGTYIISTQNACRIRVFEEGNSTPIAQVNDKTELEFSIETDKNIYFKFFGTTIPIEIGKVKIEKGSKATPYSPYGQGSIEIYNGNKNFLDFTNYQTFTATNTYYAIKANDFELKSRLKYIFNFSASGDFSTANAIKLWFRDANNSSFKEALANTEFSLTEEESNKLSYIQIVVQALTSGKTYSGHIYPMIRLASDTDDAYISHQSQTKALYTQQPFRAIGDVEDRFVKQNGVWYEEHNIGELVLNGTESWSVARSLSSNLLLQTEITNLADLQSVNGIISDYFIGTNGDFIWSANDGKYYIAGNSSNKIRISLNITKFSTISSFTKWLTTNNAKVYYQLATPTLIECTPEQVEVLNDIYSAYGEGMTNIICNDEIEPVIEIVKETKETVQSENDKAISALIARVEELEKLVSEMQSVAAEEGA